MTTILMLLGLIAPAATTSVAQIQPCVWPNTCAAPAVIEVAQITTCVWPNPCAVETRGV